MTFDARMEGVRGGLDNAGVDALLVTNLTNVRYLTGFSGTNGQVLVTRDEALFFSDQRYRARAETLVQAAEIVIYPLRLLERLKEWVEGRSIQRLGIEATTMTIAQRDELDEALDVALVATKKVVEGLRRSKDPGEVAAIREAIRIGDATFEWILDRLVPGATERDVALELEVHMRELGADAIAFDPIVGSGPLSAHIHHTPGGRALEKGDIVLMDFGCTSDGYRSDLTRTVVLGSGSAEQHRIYETVFAAQRAGIDAAVAGASCREVDAAARSVISEAGHGDAFGHGLGHGVGLDIHEEPRMNRDAEEHLVDGDVVTIEPGIYLPDRSGIRIEDCVLVADGACEVLGSARKDSLIEI